MIIKYSFHKNNLNFYDIIKVANFRLNDTANLRNEKKNKE